MPKFRDTFFKEVELSEHQLSQKLSPKILVVAPWQRLSWQYHHRRAEIWKLIFGEGKISTSQTDEENPAFDLNKDEVVSLEKGERHRLIGGDNWGVVAEIWMHTDPSSPSNEDDIVRVSDDYARK
ncbi:cupin domain-containing protein [Algoriphagus sediminis]|uniref:cupin domain-containing protein n=1 Tax=Algoriphagus sediminis TaxID=3057113 RepID=UPI0033906351